jgi:hypothetical protein
MNGLASLTMRASWLLLPGFLSFAGYAQGEEHPAAPSPTILSCKAARGEVGIFEPLRYMTITVDMTKKYVKMIHQGDGKIFEYNEGDSGLQGGRNFVKVTDDLIVFGQQGHEIWKIDRFTGTLTNSTIAIPFECQVRPTERKF